MPLFFGTSTTPIYRLYIGEVPAGTISTPLPTPVININTATGQIISTVTKNTSGYVDAGSVSSTLALNTQSSITITPTNATITAVEANKYTVGAVKIGPVPTETATFTANGTYNPSSGKWFSQVTVNIPIGATVKNQNKTVTPSESIQYITCDVDGNNYTGLGQVTVNAITATYVGSGITRRSVTDLSIEPLGLGNIYTVSVPKGYYENNVGYSLPEGSVSTPVATKSNVSNHQISITPSVSYNTGYITDGSKTGTAITVTASELVSGNKEITNNGTNIDVTNYATVSVDVVTGSTATFTTLTATANGVYSATDSHVDGFSSVTVNVPSGGITPTGDLTITANGALIDVSNYATVTVDVPSEGIQITDTLDTHGGTIRTITATAIYGNMYNWDNISMNNYSDTNVYLESATSIMPYTFAGMTSLQSIDAPNVVRFGDSTKSNGNGNHVFYGCTNLTSVNLPSLVNVNSGGYQFAGCTSLTTINLPCNPGQYMFSGCTGLKTAVLRGTGNLNGNGFRGCSNLITVDTKGTRIYTNEFINATKLNILILRSSSRVTLSNTNAFSGTPFASGGSGGTIYIPKSLYDSLGTGTNDYKTASGWSTIDGYGTITWTAIEGSQYENYYADGTAIS